MTDVDVAVVGGGIIGALAVRELLDRAPGRRIALLERDVVGAGASGRSAGLHFPRGATARVRALSAAGEDFYARLRAADPTVPIHPLDAVVIGGDVGKVYLDRPVPVPVDRVPDEVVVPEGARAWSVAGCHYADVGALTATLVRRLRPHADVREGVAVVAVEPAADEVRLVLGTGDVVRAGSVVLAPGPWVHAPAWHDLVAPLGLRVKLVVALHVDRVPPPDAPLVVLHDDDSFLLPVRHRGHWLFSHTSTRWDVRPDELTGGLSADMLAEGRAALARHAPASLPLATSGRVFCDAYSPAREPVVQALDPACRVVFAGAANGSGYRLGPAIASAAADLALEPAVQRNHA
ncbi:NAD(P)/FAD-dependent oxidoreductase [Actinosynnema sp. CS-041913]|uniref:NAD(P)/FAD-dependent oxidoreductase n=1 Tax=Actinosynnema sp. CS-041913 TaxID=3239917 RepID=UPI003D91A5BF